MLDNTTIYLTLINQSCTYIFPCLCRSDGPQPHYINMEFLHNTSLQVCAHSFIILLISLKSICIYTDYSQDESYTPSNIVIKVGNHFHDLTVRATYTYILSLLQVKIQKNVLVSCNQYSITPYLTARALLLTVVLIFLFIQTVTSLELEEPMGWVTIKLKDSKDRSVKCYKARCYYFIILIIIVLLSWTEGQ